MSFRAKILSAFGWSVGIKVGFQIVTWAMTLLVIRILAPEDYGLMAISQVFINFMLGFANLGLGDALVQRENTPKEVVASVFGVLIVVSAALTLLLALAAYPIAAYYADIRLAPLIQVASLGFMFNGLTVLPRMHLTKSLRVKPMFVTELSSGLAGAATVIVLAYAGWGVWALMLGWLVGNAVKMIGLIVLTSEYYVWPSLDVKLVRPLFGYGLYRTLEYTAWMVFTSADVLIIGRLLGSAELGLYAVAMNFAAMPLSKIAPIVNSIAFPAFAMVQTQPAAARFYALKALRLMAIVAVPVFFGISATAPEIVDLVFGPHWLEAKPILGLLSAALAFRAILLLLPNYLTGIGDARAAFWCTATSAVMFPPAFLIACHWGVTGVCCAWLFGYPVVYAISAEIARRHGNLDIQAILVTPVRPMAAGVVMMFVVMSLRIALPDGWPEGIRLGLLVAAGAGTYGGVLFFAFRDLALEVFRLFGMARAASPGIAAEAG